MSDGKCAHPSQIVGLNAPHSRQLTEEPGDVEDAEQTV